MKLVQISDCHLFAAPDQAGYANISPARSLSKVLQAVAAEKPDGVLVTGDISGDGSALSYQLFLSLMAYYCGDLNWRVIPGNHDNNSGFSGHLSNQWLKPGQPWQVGDTIVHGLDTRDQGTLGYVCEKQLMVIAGAIAAQADNVHVLALHHHPVPTQSWMDKHALRNTQALSDFVLANPIAMLLHGHIHADYAAQLNGCPVYGVPSTCWQWQLSKDFGVSDAPAGYRIITSDSAKLSTTIVRIA
ncbi:metallophosphoesterase family protein [Alteromonas gilva]|uniref:Metallophosphoesterase n=1 Tax=Alteromonas gilva TaxID=2987522 RepID=A0ABT5L8V6_9ALTE|nr:metallophosphoesterase [Alteromonas gilva]MDC8833066.1 metallophosphoesterase [Alteromonas gilva]